MRKIAIVNGVLDYPNSVHKSHTNPIPYLGGIAIIIGVTITSYSSLFFSKGTRDNLLLASFILGPAVALGIIGLFDDIRSLNPLPRFISQSIAGIIVSIFIISTNKVGNPSGLTSIDIAITIVWIVGISNAINFFDNIDGGAAGTAAISATGLTYLSIQSQQQMITALSIVIVGGTLGFLVWNKSPAKIYMGDAGSLFLGVILATLAIRLNPTADFKLTSMSIPILLLAIPILDTSIAVYSRIRRNISPFRGGKDHLSHRLIRVGINRWLVVLLLWGLSLLFTVFACSINTVQRRFEFPILLLALLIWISLFLYFSSKSDE
jgi:UDP-GlcNAc:undecaprenyl-phosphate GlcNAc-1-phosphate transferase